MFNNRELAWHWIYPDIAFYNGVHIIRLILLPMGRGIYLIQYQS